MRVKLLSHILDENTPTYGNRNTFECTKKSSILNGDIANDSFLKTTVHIGTHVDMPYHFYENGQSIEDFDDSFWVFENVGFIELEPQNFIIKDELKKEIDNKNFSKNLELLIVKTGICHKREEEIFWSQNYGFDPSLYDFLRVKFPNLRVFGFDSISVSSFTNRMLGRIAHKKFLNPQDPILLLEDMNLVNVSKEANFKRVIIAPLRIKKCDGLPCSVMGFLDD